MPSENSAIIPMRRILLGACGHLARAAWLAFLFCAGAALGAERIAQWRTYPAGELSGVSSVTLSPRGRVIARHSDGSAVSIFDGFTSRQLQLPENIGLRVYESRSGQFWGTYSEGLYLYQRGQWTRHQVEQLRPRGARSPSIMPAEVDRILALMPDRLLEYSAANQRVSVLKNVSDTKLGAFFEMIEASDGSLLITASNGVARVQGPLRHISSNSPWLEFPLPPGSTVENVQRPFEGLDGSIMTVSFDRDRSEARHLLTAGENGWSDQIFYGEKVRLAWPGWGGTRWGSGYNALYRFTGRGTNDLVKERVGETFFDAAANTNGVFWLATSSGLIRYAPLLWRTPPELMGTTLGDAQALAITAGESALWLATAEGLLRVDGGKAERFGWPDEFESQLSSVDAVYEMKNGQVLINAARCIVFDPSRRKFDWLKINSTVPARALGAFRDGSICVRLGSGLETRLNRLDGERLEAFVGLSAIGASSEPMCFLEARDGHMWLGGGFGLARFKPGDSGAQLYAGSEGVFPERIFCLAEVGEDRLWAGGVDSIFEFHDNHWVSVRSGFQRVHSIVRARDGAIWVSSNSGVHRFVDGIWLGHAEEEGLPSSVTPSMAVDWQGRLWAATSRGAAAFFPESDLEEPRTLAPAMMERSPDDEPGVDIVLSGVDKWNYTSAGRLLFSYRLDEGSWTGFTNAAVASFRNLSAGPHYLQARAMDRNGNKDLSIATLEFNVTLPWSRDPRLVGVLIFAGCVALFLAGLAINRHWKLKRSYAEVGRLVAERTAELEKANQELLHSQKMRALGTLAAGIAHDFNNILSIIKGSAQIIENNPDDKEKVLTRANRIQTVVAQGSGIVRSMLGLGKSGDRTECEAGELIDEIVKLLSDRFSDDVEIRQEKIGTIPRFMCSKEVIHQILQNLILNAVDAMQGKGVVLLRTRLAEKPGEGTTLAPGPSASYLAIEVIDKGVGIPADALPRIFEPFYTTKAFSSRRGTGLGLSMVYELAKGMGYGLSVNSKQDEGSTFTLLIPLP